MELVRWNPFGGGLRARNPIGSLFNELLQPALCINEDMAANAWNPTVDVYENKDEIIIKAELPGVEKKDIKVDVNAGILTLKGERNHEKEVKEEDYYRKESVYGKFERSFKLPGRTDFDKIKADLKDGILKVSVPKTEETKPKKITIH
ncbi:MAG: Hsp20/alpha crystallin family protein [Desulfobacterales bacterium]